jgi:hypothetical protein
MKFSGFSAAAGLVEKEPKELRIPNYKSQIPNTKYQTKYNDRNSKFQTIGF